MIKVYKKYKIDNRIIELETSSATVKEAAESLGTEECRIAKTLSFIIDDKPILIVAAGDAKIDNSKYKSQFHTKAKMIPSNEVNLLINLTIKNIQNAIIKKLIILLINEPYLI